MSDFSDEEWDRHSVDSEDQTDGYNVEDYSDYDYGPDENDVEYAVPETYEDEHPSERDVFNT